MHVTKVYISANKNSDQTNDPSNGVVDVIVLMDDEHKYSASFFSYAYIEHIRNINIMTGEFLGGKYYWARNMVLVEECSPEVINPVVNHLIDEGEFDEVFRML